MNEINCPFCDCYRDVSDDELKRLQRHQRCKNKEIVCIDCWDVMVEITNRWERVKEQKV